MSEWLPLLVGFGWAALLAAPMLLFPRSRWTREIMRPLGVRPSGAGGTLTRSDLARSGVVLIVIVAPLLVAGGVLCTTLGRKYAGVGNAEPMGLALSFLFIILAMMAVVGGIGTLFKALFYRPGRTWATRLVPRIEADEAGMRVVAGDVRLTVRWDRVLRVGVLRRKLVTVDEIILGIVHLNEQDEIMTVELSEEWYGFEGLAALLPRVLPGVPDGWYQREARPALSSEPTILYDRLPAE